MRIDEATYVVGVWFIAWREGTVDWMAIVTKEGEERFALEYRFRYDRVNCEKTHGPIRCSACVDAEERSGYEGVYHGPEANVVESVRVAFEHLARSSPYGTPACADEVMIRARGGAVVAALAKMPWAHMTVTPTGKPTTH